MNSTKKNILLILLGGAIGAVNGLFGGGGGMIVVPLLALLLKENPKVCHATAIAIILPVSVVSALVYIFNKSIDWKLCLFVTLGVVIGGIVGAELLVKLRANWIKKLFAIVMLLSGIKLAFF